VYFPDLGFAAAPPPPRWHSAQSDSGAALNGELADWCAKLHRDYLTPTAQCGDRLGKPTLRRRPLPDPRHLPRNNRWTGGTLAKPTGLGATLSAFWPPGPAIVRPDLRQPMGIFRSSGRLLPRWTHPDQLVLSFVR